MSDLVSDNEGKISRRPDLPEVAWAAWWDAIHIGTEQRYMTSGAVLSMGRSSQCEIRIGADPFPDERVPREWAQLSWHRGRVMVANVHHRWGLELSCEEQPGIMATVISPNGVATAPWSTFVLEAKVPADLQHDAAPAEFRINLLAVPTPVEPRSMEADEHVAETTPVLSLTRTQRAVGAAIIEPLTHGRARRASYEALVHSTNYAMRTVREAVAAMDIKFVGAGLAFPGDGDALDRVAYVLGRHRLDH